MPNLTKCLHTVTVVRQVALHLAMSQHRQQSTNGSLVRNALAVLGHDAHVAADHPVFAACVAALDKVRK